MSKNDDLYEKIHRKELELYNCVSLLENNSNLGVQYHICQRVQQYPIMELRFYAPQFLQLLITVDTQSMALEEMIKKLCSRDPHFALMTFWHLQALLQDLSAEPESIGFQTCKRLINELQYDYFNYSTSQRTATSPIISATGVVKTELGSRFQPNIVPSLVLATSLMAGVTVPEATKYVSPIVKLQGKQIKAVVFEVLKDVQRNLTENLTKKNTMNNALLSGKSSSKNLTDLESPKRPRSATLTRSVSSSEHQTSDTNVDTQMRKSHEVKLRSSTNDPYLTLPKKTRVSTLSKLTKTHSSSALNKTNFSHLNEGHPDYTHSMPDLHGSLHDDFRDSPSITLNLSTSYSSDTSTRTSAEFRDSFDILSSNDQNQHTISNSIKSQQHLNLTKEQQIKLLKSNYFKNETQFVIALQNISIRLSKVPKEARLSTLKAELSVLNSDLPCEIDIPMLLPKSKKGKLHKICNIAINESAVLNSAERVPYLLLIEYLSDAVDFDPSVPHNKKILHNIEEAGDFGTSKKNKYKFDLSFKSENHRNNQIPLPSYDKNDDLENDFIESDLADVSVVKLTNKLADAKVNDGANSLAAAYVNDNSKHIAGQLRIASIMLQQLQSSNSPIPADQATALKQRIIDSMNVKQKEFAHKSTEEVAEQAGERKLKNDMKVAGLSYLGEDWHSKKERIRKESPYGHLENWDLFSMIAKTGDDLAQEAFACQLIQLMANIWYQDKVKVWVKKMKILVTSISTGLVETITNAVSVHSIKKALEQHKFNQGEVPIGITLKDHFKLLFGDETSEKYQRAQENFAKSLSAYSIICYILQIKDRHNGNIMFDSEGHIVHIDFGFLLSNSPGSIGFEAAPFKLTQEYVDILGGTNSYYFKYFVQLTKDAFKSLRHHADVIVDMVELMQKDSSLPCFMLGANTSIRLKQRFELSMSDEEAENFIDVLISKSLNSAYTKLYDQFQLMTQGIYI